MTSLLNRTCILCHTTTYEEGGFVECDCMSIDKDAWANGVCETPKEWIRPLAILSKPAFRFVNNGDVSIRIQQGNHTYKDLVILDMRLEDKGFGWFTHQVLMEDEYQTEPRYFPTLRETVNDAMDHLRNKHYVLWTNKAKWLEEFLEANHE